MGLLRRFADPIVRRQLVRAIAARDEARDEVRSLTYQLAAARNAGRLLARDLAVARHELWKQGDTK